MTCVFQFPLQSKYSILGHYLREACISSIYLTDRVLLEGERERERGGGGH